jgi:hypothetical protein
VIAPALRSLRHSSAIVRRGAFHCRPGAGTGEAVALLTGIGNAKLLPGVIGPLCGQCGCRASHCARQLTPA